MRKLLTTGEDESKVQGPKSKVLERAAHPLSPERSGEAREEMRELIATVRPVALRERLLKVWARW